MARRVRLLSALGVGIGFSLWLAAPAGAVVEGPCRGEAIWQGEPGTVRASESGTVTVPKEATVRWAGLIVIPPRKGMSHSGEISVQLPPPFADLTIDSWSGTTDKIADQGRKHYELPDVVPGIEFTVSGTHEQAGAVCTGHVTVKVDGGAGPAGIVLTALLIPTGALLFTAGRPRP